MYRLQGYLSVKQSRHETTSTVRYLMHALFAVLVLGSWASGRTLQEDFDALLDLSLEELMNVEIFSPAALTKTKARLVPAAVTTVSQEDILHSGARSLYEVLDIFVPGVQIIDHTWEAAGVGHRGLYSDRNDKYLLLVNGRVLNNRMHFGALTEQDLVMLRDIHHVDIVRGPGSALYGPGGISMVVNIVTDDSTTFDGTEATIRNGMVEDYVSGEFKLGHRFTDGDGGLFLYGSISEYRGADGDDAPFIMATDLPTQSGDNWVPVYDYPNQGAPAGSTLTGTPIGRDGDSYRGLTPLKFHAELNRDNWNLWARYTRGGKKYVANPGVWTHVPLGWANWVGPADTQTFGAGYQQATLHVEHHQELSEKASIDYVLSYDMQDFQRINGGYIDNASREDEYVGRIMLKNNLNERHSLATGVEFSYEMFGLKSPGYPAVDEGRSGLFPDQHAPRWDMLTSSAVLEWQWNISDQLSFFSGGRIDHTKYTGKMISPRFSLVHSPTDQDTLKYMVGRSVRAPFASEMRYQDTLGGGSESDPEELDSIEIRYERQQSKALSFAGSWYWYDIDLVTWDGGLSRSVRIGTQRTWGLELEAHYRADRTLWSLSHGFNQFDSMDLLPGRTTVEAPHVFGYGKHLTSWSDHITKLHARFDLDDAWTVDGSLRVYWGFPGNKDYQQYLLNEQGYITMQEGWEKTFRGSYFLNLGLQYKPSERFTFRVDGYNLLGLFNKDLNKRTYGADVFYRDEAPAVGLSMICRTQ